MTTSKSPLAVATVAYEAGRKTLPLYRHECSPKKFTQPQLFACLVMKAFFNTDYRGIMIHLLEHRELRSVLELGIVPHYTTLQKASKSMFQSKNARKIMRKLLRMFEGLTENKKHPIALFDSTGFEFAHASGYFKWRKESGTKDKPPLWFKRYPKLSLASLPVDMLIATSFASLGPSTDMPYFARLLKATCSYFTPQTVIADAGYDREANHIIARERQIETIIPARAHCRGSLPKTPHRLRMKMAFPKERYGIRWHIETVMSMLKRNLGSRLFGKTFRSQSRELSLKVITHNCMVV